MNRRVGAGKGSYHTDDGWALAAGELAAARATTRDFDCWGNTVGNVTGCIALPMKSFADEAPA